MDDSESLAHTKWECKVPWGLDSQVSAQGAVRRAPQVPGARVPRPGPATRVYGGGGPPPGGPRAHVDLHSPEVCRGPGDRVCEGQACHSHRPDGPWAAGRISPGSPVGPGATTSRPWAAMRPRFGSTSKSKRRRTSASTNSRSSRGNATFRWR